jgi:hypothetical protein
MATGWGGTSADSAPNPSTYANQTFYGFRTTPVNGNLDVEILTGDVPVTIPDPDYIVGPNDYKAWVWSTGTFQFRWGAKGHLEMVIV